jgi:hypothetical protein
MPVRCAFCQTRTLVPQDRGTFIAQYHFSNTRGDDADPILAGVMPFNNRDVRVTHVTLELLAYPIKLFPASFDQLGYQHAGYARGRPEEYLRGSVIIDDLGLDISGVHVEMVSQTTSAPVTAS